MVKAEMKMKKEASSSNSKNKQKKYKGVRMRSWGSWVSEIRAPNQKTRIWLGSYSTAEAAARAYDAALLCLKGSSANLNFPSSTSSLFVPQDTSLLSPKSIQRVAAAAAANSFVDNNTPTPTTTTNSPTSNSSSFVSSPISMSSSSPPSPSHQFDDDVSLFSSLGTFNTSSQQIESLAMMEPWYDDLDQMLSGPFFDVHSTLLLDDLYEESGEIPLWSFC